MFKKGDKVVFTQKVLNKMKEVGGASTAIFPDDCCLTAEMYKDGIKKEYMIIGEAKGKFTRMKDMRTGDYNWDERWFDFYEEELKGAEDF